MQLASLNLIAATRNLQGATKRACLCLRTAVRSKSIKTAEKIVDKSHVLLSICTTCTRICEWLPETALWNISVHAHEYSNEPATSLQPLCKTCTSLVVVVASFMAVVLALYYFSFSGLLRPMRWTLRMIALQADDSVKVSVTVTSLVKHLPACHKI